MIDLHKKMLIWILLLYNQRDDEISWIDTSVEKKSKVVIEYQTD